MSGAEFQEREAELFTVGARRRGAEFFEREAELVPSKIEERWNHLLIPLLGLLELEFRVGG